ncbi:TetR/AcrR family transcriptional regulator [Aureivirga sp. CE67]|uniref:TetR/AcrR family transcriptional regulator n=1 Tax=Aureivirga sp. CE67 TaxID=1788983 RepID=UPI0018CB2B64|nr:TetR/AcrR family transcriptional regulator [Aureivirga sp. CE67]
MKVTKPKERILEVATVLFHKQGYNSTGINQIIKEASVAKASFYQHFKSKEDLAKAYLTQRHIFWFENFKEDVETAKNEKQKIHAAFEFLKKMNQKENYNGCAFLKMEAEIQNENVELNTIIQNHKKDLRTYFDSFITDKEKSFLVYMLFEACLTESKVFKNADDIEKTIKLIDKSL